MTCYTIFTTIIRHGCVRHAAKSKEDPTSLNILEPREQTEWPDSSGSNDTGDDPLVEVGWGETLLESVGVDVIVFVAEEGREGMHGRLPSTFTTTVLG